MLPQVRDSQQHTTRGLHVISLAEKVGQHFIDLHGRVATYHGKLCAGTETW